MDLTGIIFELHGLRVDYWKLQGPFRKNISRRGIYGSDPFDHDRMAEDVTVRDLISAVHSRSGDSDQKARGAAALGRQRWLPAAVPRWGSPELADPAVRGLVWPGIWPRSSSTAWVIH